MSKYQVQDVELLNQLAILEARESFWAYRQFINPRMKKGWWQREIAYHLQSFYNDLVEGKKPKLVIEAPPQHGKSEQIIDFISWLSGKNPSIKTIYTSFSERLGIRANLRLQRIYDGKTYKSIFPETLINNAEIAKTSGSFLRNRELLEYVGQEGFFRNTTVGGSITGEGLDLGIVDDPIKGREEAGSITVRNKKWDWFTDDFFTRFSEDAGLLCILTRWHIDDPIGRLKAIMPEVKTVSYPAIAVRKEKNRVEGEALFPEHKSLEFILERKSAMATANFESLYQQNPILIGGNIIKGEYFRMYSILPKLLYRNIYADTAQKTKESNDYTVFECWGKGEDGNIYLVDLWRGKWDSVDLERNAILFWNKHNVFDAKNPDFNHQTLGKLRAFKVEDKVSGTGLIQALSKKSQIPVVAIQRNVDKYTRICDNLGYIESGYVHLPQNAGFTQAFIAECEEFSADDSHSFDDQVDPLMDAIEDMLTITKKSFYD